MEKENYKLQYGDIIQIDSETNKELHEINFFIKFINSSKIVLINENISYTLDISEEGKLLDESIDNIILIYKQKSPSYIVQNDIKINTNISIYFGGNLPKIINGIVTNTEEDMIEITCIPNKEIIYIDFAYSGIPENLNIEKIIISDNTENTENITHEPEEVIDKIDELTKSNELSEKNIEYLNLENNDDLDYDLTKNIDEDKLNEILLDDFELETEYEEFYHNVNVPENEKRYTLETQLNDYMDYNLNKLNKSEVNNDTIERINLELNRYKELRNIYSNFDSNNNPVIIEEKGEFYKPLKEILLNLNKKIYWILPVVYNNKILINNTDNEFDEDHINKIKMGEFIEQLNKVINKWVNSNSKDKINDYKTYINNLLSVFDNTMKKYTPDFNSINSNNMDVNTQILAINDLYDDFYSFCINNNEISKNRFSTQVFNEGLKMLDSDYINNKKIYNLKTLTQNDKMTIISFITLPLPIFNFSKINLEYTNIYDKSNLSTNFLNYFELLNNETNINKYILEQERFNDYLNSHDNIHNNKLFNSIANFSIDDVDSINSIEKYNTLLESFIPTNSSIIKYLSNTNDYTNFKSIINDLQALNIDMYNLNIKDYEAIKKIFNTNITEYKKNYNQNKELLNKLINILNNNLEENNYVYNFNLINKELKQELFDTYNIDESLYNNSSELINNLFEIDNGKFFISCLNKNIMDLLVSNLLDNYIKIAEKNKEIQETELSEEDCEKYYLSKKYTSIEELQYDDNKQIFFDSIYDNTLYSLNNEYNNEKNTMDKNNFLQFLTNKIMDIMNLTKEKAMREANSIIEEKRQILDGDYALLIDKETNKNYIYIRSQSKWILDDKFKNDFYIDSNKILCNINKDCISINDDCFNSNKSQQINLKENTEKIINSFNTKYNLSIEELKGKINEIYDNNKKFLKNILKIKNEKNMYVNNILLQNYMPIDDSITLSPYEKLKDKILNIKDFIKRQDLIKKFCIKFTRESINDENKYWLYCNKTNNKLIPKFIYKLANAFINNNDYITELDTICSEQGTISDDNNYWVDKHSGYIIKNIDFSNEEGYDEKGYKLNTKELLENEYSIKLSKNDSTNPDIKIINNIINSITQMAGINLDSQNQFIINNVISILNANIPTKENYEKLLEKNKKDGKKPLPTYDDTYNQLLLLLTLSYIIVAIQINIPNLTTKKTFPGCIKSFSGYPLNNEQDKTSIIYISCIANKIKSSIKPWNTLLKMSENNIAKKIENIIEKFVINDKIYLELSAKKKEYLLLNIEETIPDELSISNWYNFMPPLYNFKISKTNITPLDDTFINDIKKIDKKYSDNNILDIIQAKNIYLSNNIIEIIQKIIESNSILLENSAGEPYLENACCNSNINTIYYFIKKDKTILENNQLIQYYKNIIQNIQNLNKAKILYNAENTKLILPSISSDFNEETIYKAFIYYCNFDNDLPIDDELKSICNDKPSNFDKSKNIKEIIESLKDEGKIYNKSSLEELIHYINKNNIIVSNYNYPTINNIESLRTIIFQYKESHYDNNIDEKMFTIFYNLLDTYDINNFDNNNTILDSLKNYLVKVNNIIKISILEHIRKLPSVTKVFKNNMEKLLNFEINIDMPNFYENYLNNLLNIFPNIILNKNIDYNKIPLHWKLSDLHNKDISNIIENYYKKLNTFTSTVGLDLVFNIIKNKCNIFLKLIKFIKYNKPIIITDNDGKNIELPSIFDKEFIKYFYTYVFYCIFNEYINITQNEQFLLQITEYTDYNNIDIQNSIIEFIYEFLTIKNNHLDLINNTHDKIKNRISLSKEKEKDSITQYLKDLTDEEREVENIFKNNKLEKWNAGLQKGLTQYVQENYDEERLKLEKEIIKESKLNNNNINELNKDIYKFDMDENEKIENEIYEEEFSMNNIPNEDDFSDNDDNDDDDYY